MTDTKWVLTIETDGPTVHVEVDSEIEAEDLAMSLWLGMNRVPPVEGADIREVPLTWECDGRDRCQVFA